MNTSHETQTVDVDALRADFEALQYKLLRTACALRSFVHTDLYGPQVARRASDAVDAIAAVRDALHDREVTVINEVLYG